MKLWFLVILISAIFFSLNSNAQDSNLKCQKLFFYLEENRTQDIVNFLKMQGNNICLNAINENGMTLPLELIKKDNISVLSALIDNAVLSPDFQSNIKNNKISLFEFALHVSSGKSPIIKYLLSKNVDLRIKMTTHFSGQSPLAAAVFKFENEDLAVEFVNNGADVNETFTEVSPYDKKTFTYSIAAVAIQKKYNNLLSELIKKGLNPNSLSQFTQYIEAKTPAVPLISHTALDGNVIALKILLDSGADLNKCIAETSQLYSLRNACPINFWVRFKSINWLLAAGTKLNWLKLRENRDDSRSIFEIVISTLSKESLIKYEILFPLTPRPEHIGASLVNTFDELRPEVNNFLIFERGWLEYFLKNNPKKAYEYLYQHNVESESDPDQRVSKLIQILKYINQENRIQYIRLELQNIFLSPNFQNTIPKFRELQIDIIELARDITEELFQERKRTQTMPLIEFLNPLSSWSNNEEKLLKLTELFVFKYNFIHLSQDDVLNDLEYAIEDPNFAIYKLLLNNSEEIPEHINFSFDSIIKKYSSELANWSFEILNNVDTPITGAEENYTFCNKLDSYLYNSRPITEKYKNKFLLLNTLLSKKSVPLILKWFTSLNDEDAVKIVQSLKKIAYRDQPLSWERDVKVCGRTNSFEVTQVTDLLFLLMTKTNIHKYDIFSDIIPVTYMGGSPTSPSYGKFYWCHRAHLSGEKIEESCGLFADKILEKY